MDFNVIFIAGPQGSGKGTQGKKLAEKLGFLFWGMGGILRGICKEDTPLAKKIVGIMNEGTLLSDEVIIEVLKDRLAIDYHAPLHGYPVREGLKSLLCFLILAFERDRFSDDRFDFG